MGGKIFLPEVYQKEGYCVMNGLTIVGGSILVFLAAYLCYGRWLARTWGIDGNAATPAHRYEDGQDFAPASRFTVFSHQFSSITGQVL